MQRSDGRAPNQLRPVAFELDVAPHATGSVLVSTGNISNRDLEALMVPLIPEAVREFGSHSFLELGRAGIVVRG